MDRVQWGAVFAIFPESKLMVFLRFNMLDKGIERHIEQKRTEAIALEDPTSDSNEGSIELLSYYRGLEIGVKTTNKTLYVIGNVMIVEDLVNKVMVDFTECILEIQ
jgi:hypothetical protein